MLQETELSGQADSENDLGVSSETMYYIGLDVHKKTISYCVKDAAGCVFSEGKINSSRRDLDVWIAQGACDPNESEEREDHYLACANVACLGVKLREGRLEVKREDDDLGFVDLGSRVTGRLGFWRKWSFTMADDEAQGAPDGYWISVAKRRFLRKYSRVDPGLIVADGVVAGSGSLPAGGCNVELTALRVRNAQWWSVGFEAFGGDEGELQDRLMQAAAKCFGGDKHPALRGEDSYGYPKWLAMAG